MEFDRILKIVDKEDFKRIQDLKILIVGVGGVGGYAMEALIRSGILNLTIVDNDNIDITNLNRQIISLNTNIGCKKVDIAKKRCLDINKNCNVKTIDSFITKDNIDDLFLEKYDFIIDACDTITTKVLLIKYSLKYNIKIISSMGTGNRFNPEKLCITTLNKTNNDPVAKVMRKLLKEENIPLKIPVVWSSELPIKTRSRIPGSLILVPATAGIYMASYIINQFIEK